MDEHNVPHTEEYEEELKTAMVCEDNPEYQKAITSALGELKYNVEIASSAADSFDKVRFNRYDVIVLNEKFGGASPENNEVLKHFQHMPMATRRHIFLALIGNDLKTSDNMTAFAKSANTVVNESDLPNLKAILRKSIADNDRFYKVYKESLIKMGKR